MPLIDVHVHLYSPEVNQDPAGWAASRQETLWATLCTRRRKNGSPVQGFPGVDELLREMDAAGVAKAVLLGWYWEHAETCTEQNRFYARCLRRHPDRLAAFAALQPRAGSAMVQEEMRRAQGEGLIGLGELSPHAQGYAIDDPALAEALTLAAEFGWPVNVHVTDPASRSYPGRFETPLMDFRRLAEANRNTTFILAHWGGGLPLLETNPVVQAELANVYYDTAASPLMYGPGIWRRVLDVIGAPRVLFGSDYPLIAYPQLRNAPEMTLLVEETRTAGLDARELAMIHSANARRLLKLS